jgi:hypothetical protein
VDTVNWDEATEFCRKLSAMPAERAAGRTYRLPTEAEWEYACRAGTTTRWYCGDDEAGLDEYAWFEKNADRMTHPVGKKKPNAWGLYDMQGQVQQWCSDWFSEDYYKRSPLSDPTGPATDEDGTKRSGNHVARGIFVECGAFQCRSAYRDSYGPLWRGIRNGFRVVVEVAAKEQVRNGPATPASPGAAAGSSSSGAGSTDGQAASGTQPQMPNPQSPTPSPASEAMFFVGDWRVGVPGKADAIISLHKDSTARSTLGGTGKWELINGEARIRWSVGAWNIIRREGSGYRKLFFKAGMPLDGPPADTGGAEKISTGN